MVGRETEATGGRRRLFWIVLLILFLAGVSAAQDAGGNSAKATLARLMTEGSASLRYTGQFRKAVSEEQLQGVLDSLEKELGRFVEVRGESSPFELRFANGMATARIVLSSEGKIAGIHFSNPTKESVAAGETGITEL